NSSSSQYKSNITVYNPATGERTALENTPSLYAYSGGEFIDDLRNFNWSGIRDGIREEFFDYKPNNSREGAIALVNGANSDITKLPPIKIKATENPNIVYALGGVNSTYNMTAALAGIQQKAMRQGAEVRPLNGFDAFYQTKVGSYINAYKTGGVNSYKGLYAMVRETIYTSYDVSIGSIIRDINPDAKPAGWFAQSLDSKGVYSTGKTVVQNVTLGAVDGVLGPFRALYSNDYNKFAESLPAFSANILGGKVIQPAPKPIEYINLYHGTSKTYASDIRVYGIDITKSKMTNDFGEGFYLTSSRDDALSSATMVNNMDNIDILEFRIPKDKYNDLNHLEFKSPNREWQDFVILNKGVNNYIDKNGNTIPFYRPPQEWNVKLEDYDLISGPLFRRINSEGKMLHWEDRQPQVVVRSSSSAWLFNQYMVDK
ncbi:DUF3990 domain-containing protein, partial [Acinetobacter baumannii]|uniref:DUF3990 domain-containing protein n=1 Tax=Acinetobacter baumannii TaxID=470 RepID=UPI00338E5979